MKELNKERKKFAFIVLLLLILIVVFSSIFILIKKQNNLKKLNNTWASSANFYFQRLEDIIAGQELIPCYEISTPEQLIGAIMLFESETKTNSKNATFVEDWESSVTPDTNNSAYFKLSNNIDLSGKSWTVKNLGQNCIIDGCGYAVKNLSITTPVVEGDINRAGFVLNNNGEIKNLTFDNCNITLNSESTKIFAGMVTANNNGTINHCTIKNNCVFNITGGLDKENIIGGIAGYSVGDIYNCINQSIINVSAWHIGGITGNNGQGGNISNCFNYGEIGGTTNSNHIRNGGITGSNSGNINHCYNSGKILGDTNKNDVILGGIVGDNYYSNNGTEYGKILYSANMGDITGGSSTTPIIKAGGIIGFSNGGIIENCYNTGDLDIKAKVTQSAKTVINDKVSYYNFNFDGQDFENANWNIKFGRDVKWGDDDWQRNLIYGDHQYPIKDCPPLLYVDTQVATSTHIKNPILYVAYPAHKQSITFPDSGKNYVVSCNGEYNYDAHLYDYTYRIYVGGICGEMGTSLNKKNISNCYNVGNITTKKDRTKYTFFTDMIGLKYTESIGSGRPNEKTANIVINSFYQEFTYYIDINFDEICHSSGWTGENNYTPKTYNYFDIANDNADGTIFSDADYKFTFNLTQCISGGDSSKSGLFICGLFKKPNNYVQNSNFPSWNYYTKNVNYFYFKLSDDYNQFVGDPAITTSEKYHADLSVCSDAVGIKYDLKANVSNHNFDEGLPSGYNADIWGVNANINNGYPYLKSLYW